MLIELDKAVKTCPCLPKKMFLIPRILETLVGNILNHFVKEKFWKLN